MTGFEIIATVTNDGGTTPEQIAAVVQRLEKAMPVVQAEFGLSIGESDGDRLPLKAIVAQGTLTFVVRNRHGEGALWVAAAIAATLNKPIVDAAGDAMMPTLTTVTKILGRSPSEEGKALAEKLGLILPRIQGGVNSIKF